VKPSQIETLILNLTIPDPCGKGATISSPEFRKWEEDMQSYYDRLAELRRQLWEAVPDSMPTWVRSAAYHAYIGAIEAAMQWHRDVQRSHRALAARSGQLR
jgi:hypothetical protein